MIKQYKEMARAARASDEFIKFEIGTSRLDTLFHECLAGRKEMEDLWLVQKLLLLSHGQASIERRFSVNKETLKENMSERTLVALRVINDHIHSIGGRAECVSITPELLTAAVGAHQRYHNYLDEEKRKTTTARKGKKRKAAMEELKELHVKRKRLQASIDGILKSADEFAEDT